MDNQIVIDRFVSAFTAIGVSSFSFGEAVRLTMEKIGGLETAETACTAATEYMEKAIRAAVEDNADSETYAKLDAIPEYRVAISAIGHGSRILAKATGYKIDGNKSRLSLSDVTSGKQKTFVVGKSKAKKTTPKQKVKGVAKPAPMASEPQRTESAASVLESAGGAVDATNWQTLLKEAIKKATDKGELPVLAAIVQKAFDGYVVKRERVATAQKKARDSASAKRASRAAQAAVELASDHADKVAAVKGTTPVRGAAAMVQRRAAVKRATA